MAKRQSFYDKYFKPEDPIEVIILSFVFLSSAGLVLFYVYYLVNQ